MKNKNMSELKKIDPNAKTVDGYQTTVLHGCAIFAWVEGVKHLMSLEPKPDLTIKDNDGGSKVSLFAVKSAPSIYIF